MFSENVFCVSKRNGWAEALAGRGRRPWCPFALLLPLCTAPGPTGGVGGGPARGGSRCRGSMTKSQCVVAACVVVTWLLFWVVWGFFLIFFWLFWGGFFFGGSSL